MNLPIYPAKLNYNYTLYNCLNISIYRGADIYAKDTGGFTPMMNAITHGHKEVIKVFFNFDYCVDTVVKQGKMLLEWAIENGHLSLIEVIIPLLL